VCRKSSPDDAIWIAQLYDLIIFRKAKKSRSLLADETLGAAAQACT